MHNGAKAGRDTDGIGNYKRLIEGQWMNQAEIKRRQLQAVSMILTLLTLAVVARLTGFNGAAYTAAAVEALTVVWLIVGGNLADTLGRLIRVRISKGQHRNAAKLRRNTMIFQMAFGLAGSLIILAGADWIARTVFRLPYSTFILMVLSPTVCLRAISTVLLGYFQGEGIELPTAASGVLRQFFILGFSLLFGRMLGNYGDKVSRLLVQENFSSMYGGVGVGIAVSVAELFIVIILFLLYRGSRRSKDVMFQEGMRSTDSFVDSVRVLWFSRGWQWLTNLLLFLPIPLGLVFLQKSSAGYELMTEYGIYVAVYWVLCGIFAALVLMTLIPVYSRTVSCLRRDEQRFARTVFQSGVHIAVVHAVYIAVFLAVMAPQLARTFCDVQAETAQQMLRGGSVVVLLLTLVLYFGRFLNMTGGKILVLGSVGISDVVYVISATVLLNNGKTGILALIYAGILGLGVLCILLGAMSYRQLHTQPDWLQLILMPAVAAAVAGLICTLFGKILTPHLGDPVTLLVALVISCALYWTALLLLRNFREQELEAIPGGKLIRSLGQMLRVF